jgi:hypothetical protein
MKRFLGMTLVTMMAVGCASVGQLHDRDAIERAVLRDAGRQRVAWDKHDADGLSAEMQQKFEETKSVQQLTVHIDSITVSGDSATVYATQQLTRTVSRGGADQQEVNTFKQKQQYKRGTDGSWSASGSAETLTAEAKTIQPKA